MGILQRVHGVTLRDKVGSCEIRKNLNVEPFLRIERPQLRWVSHGPKKCPRKDRRGKSCWLHPRGSGLEVDQGPGGAITSPTLRGPVLLWRQQDCLRSLKTLRYFESSGCCSRYSPERKSEDGNEWKVSFKNFNYRVCHFFSKALQHHTSPADWDRELFKLSTDSASLLVQIKKFSVLCLGFSWSNFIMGS